uniref:DUF1028 domain-containing protein n=1 Tax=Ignisphaera aggregans TaxID=334771 RepID=A0A7J2TCG5_9CREN
MLRARERGLLAVASASGGVGVGAKVLWARAGIGAVAVQAYANPSLGVAMLEKLVMGMSSAEAVKTVISGDAYREYRQVAVLKANGDAFTYTGSRAPLFTSEHVDDNTICIGNALKDSSIPEEMCKYITSQSISNVKNLVKALINSLIIGHRLGGSRRGDKSIAILVINNTQRDKGYDRIVDVRVDYSSKPFNAVVKTLKMLGIW